jgi:hypothetical protein
LGNGGHSTSSRRSPRWALGPQTVGRYAAVVLGFAIVWSGRASGQLLSPGHLSRAHTSLEGIRQCTSCHQIGRRGVADTKCLDCHKPLQHRLALNAGFHATFGDQSCAQCHKDHGGLEADIVRFDTTSFHHDTTGYTLQGGHRELGCQDCHRAELIVAEEVRRFKTEHGALGETFLGLGTTCLDCHRTDDPHAGQFDNRACTDCHGQTKWEDVMGFDHARTRYPLTGRHRDVTCGDCHKATGPAHRPQYRPLSFGSCQACHADVHRGVMGTRCDECHSTGGWGLRNRSGFERSFDHERTRFSLIGRHAELECTSCHIQPAPQTDDLAMTLRVRSRGQTYPVPVADNCNSCHRDYHRGALDDARGGSACNNCHGQSQWYPATFDLARHNRDTNYQLKGAHATAPCTACHRSVLLGQTELQFHFETADCITCHRVDDPHVGQFADAPCESCHNLNAFTKVAFDHDRTRFKLDGAHADVSCESCHKVETRADGHTFRRYKPLGLQCRDCH